MPTYEYKCPECKQRTQFTCTIEDYEIMSDGGLFPRCDSDSTEMRRVYTFSLTPVFQEHFNLTTGTTTTSARAHADNLKRQSEEASLRTGMPHNFVPVHPSEAKEAYGVTEEGLDSTYRREVETGQREVKTWL